MASEIQLDTELMKKIIDILRWGRVYTSRVHGRVDANATKVTIVDLNQPADKQVLIEYPFTETAEHSIQAAKDGMVAGKIIELLITSLRPAPEGPPEPSPQEERE